MATLIAIILALIAGLVALGMFVQGVRGKHDLICVRNFFLMGMIIFQLISGTTGLIFKTYGDTNLSSPGPTSVIFMLVASVFLVIFWIAYETGPVVRRLAWRTAAPRPSTSPAVLL